MHAAESLTTLSVCEVMARSGLGSVLTLLAGGGVWFSGREEGNLPIVRVNEDDSLMSHWSSEEFNAPADAPPECRFWNFSVQYESTLCSHFAIGRSSSTPSRAMDRALTCAGVHGTECILSPEIGLSMPAAFVYMHERGESHMKMILAPKVSVDPGDNATQHVRVRRPDGDGVTDTKTFLFHRSVVVEYLNGQTRSMESSVLAGDVGYCVQLLRQAFEPHCWQKID